MEVKDRIKVFRELTFFAYYRKRLPTDDFDAALDLVERASQAIGIAGKYDREQGFWDIFERSIIAGWMGGSYPVWGNEDVGRIVRAILAACGTREEAARLTRVVNRGDLQHPADWGSSWDLSHSQGFYGHVMKEAEPRTLTALTLLYLDIASEQRANPEGGEAYNDAKSVLHTTETMFGFICEFCPPKMAVRAACELYRLTMEIVEGFEAGGVPATSLAPNIVAARARMFYVSLDGGL